MIPVSRRPMLICKCQRSTSARMRARNVADRGANCSGYTAILTGAILNGPVRPLKSHSQLAFRSSSSVDSLLVQRYASLTASEASIEISKKTLLCVFFLRGPTQTRITAAMEDARRGAWSAEVSSERSTQNEGSGRRGARGNRVGAGRAARRVASGAARRCPSLRRNLSDPIRRAPRSPSSGSRSRSPS